MAADESANIETTSTRFVLREPMDAGTRGHDPSSRRPPESVPSQGPNAKHCGGGLERFGIPIFGSNEYNPFGLIQTDGVCLINRFSSSNN
jgi:hypothetical protein